VASLDAWLESFMHGHGSVMLVLAVSLTLGLRHATDPDHLAAVTTLIASEEGREQVKKASLMGFSWGLGHGTTLIIIGLPLVLLGRFLPEVVVQAAEVAIGAIIVLLATRLLLRWRRGLFHAHAHVHDGDTHRHVHSHADSSSHEHEHARPLRTPLSSYGVGLVHGVGGSGGLTLLLLSTISDKMEATGALLLFAAGTAVSMALLSTVFGLAIAGGPVARNFGRVAPVLGVLGMAFGAWYALGALEVIVYPF
jgi:ABC-type nickel/cobalt efflux system permease component RcnA